MNNVTEADRQHLVFGDRDLNSIRDICTGLTLKYHSQLPKEVLANYCAYRQLPEEVFDNTDLFNFDSNNYTNIEDKATGLQDLQGRLIFPIKDVYGKVMAFCGYDPESNYKYIDSTTYGFKPKYSTFYGMELINKYLKEKDAGKPLFVTEGIVDCLCIRYIGFNCIALLGSNLNVTTQTLLEYTGGYYIADNDDNKTGIKFVEGQLKKKTPRVISYMYKDYDVKDTNDAYVKYGKETLTNMFNNIVKNIFYSDNMIGVV